MQQTADCVGVGLQQKFSFSQFRKIFAKYLIWCCTKFSSNFAKFHEIQKNFVFRKILQCCFAATLCTVGVKEEEEGGRGESGRTALRTLRANAECAYIGFHLYCFPFCHLLILWFDSTLQSSKISPQDGKISTTIAFPSIYVVNYSMISP